MKKVISLILVCLLSGCSTLAVKAKDDVPTASLKVASRFILFPLTLGLSEGAIKQSESAKLVSESKDKEAEEKHKAAKSYMQKWGLSVGLLAILGGIAGALASLEDDHTYYPYPYPYTYHYPTRYRIRPQLPYTGDNVLFAPRTYLNPWVIESW